MYADKPMRGHNLMQAIARVNRVFKDKPGGLVVDYIGIANELKAALADYTQAHGRGKPTIDAREALAVLQEQMDVLHDMLHDVEYADFRTKAWQLLPAVANHVLGLEDGKKRFADTVAALFMGTPSLPTYFDGESTNRNGTGNSRSECRKSCISVLGRRISSSSASLRHPMSSSADIADRSTCMKSCDAEPSENGSLAIPMASFSTGI
jgi:hypothetical protein